MRGKNKTAGLQVPSAGHGAGSGEFNRQGRSGIAAMRVLMRLAFAAIGLLLACRLAQAQTLGDTEEQRRRSQREAEERSERQQAPGVRLPGRETAVDSAATDLPEETPCFPIRRVHVEGTHLDAFPWLTAYADLYANRCIGRQGLDAIVKRLSARLVGEGYITTRVGIPEQNFATGELRLVLVPGIIRAIRIVGDGDDTSWRSAFPARPRDLLNLRDIEQALEQFKRLPSQDAELEIVPGESPGESDIVVKLKRGRPWRLSASLDDSGAKATGRRQASLGLAVDNPLGANDLLHLNFNNDAERDGWRHGTRGNSLGYSLPWGYWTLGLTYSTYRYHQRVKGTNQTFISSGTSTSREFSAQRVFHRDQASKTSLQLRLTHRLSRSFVDDAELLVQRRGAATAELGLTHRRYFGAAQLDLAIAHREGVPRFGGQGDGPDRAADAPTNLYRMHTIDATLSGQTRIGSQPLRLTGTLRGQATSHKLYAADQMSIGNGSTVRGFDGDATLAAERGWYLRNELEAPLGASGQSIYLGIDHGEVGGPSATGAGRRLTGAVIGLRGNAIGLSYDLFAAWAIHRPGGFSTLQPATGFRLSLQF